MMLVLLVPKAGCIQALRGGVLVGNCHSSVYLAFRQDISRQYVTGKLHKRR